MKRPDLDNIKIVGPGTRIWDWPVLTVPPLMASLRGEETVIQWTQDVFSLRPWEWFDPGGGKPRRKLFGTIWVIYFGVSGRKYADPREYLQHGFHDGGVSFETRETFIRGGEGGGIPPVGSMVGYGVAGPSRHAGDGPFHWRTSFFDDWFVWTGDQGPMVRAKFDDVEPPPPPPEFPTSVSERAEIMRLRRIWGRVGAD